MVRGLKREVVVNKCGRPAYRLRVWSRVRMYSTTGLVSLLRRKLRRRRHNVQMSKFHIAVQISKFRSEISKFRSEVSKFHRFLHVFHVSQYPGLPWAGHSVVEAGAERP